MSVSAKWGLVSCLTAVLICTAAARADFKSGQAAWDAGRHVEAVKEWRAAALVNDVRAMLALGRAFVKGLGVPQDYVDAHKWLNLAAGRGSAEAAAERDALAARMTAEERAEARKLARAWRTGRKQAASVPGPGGPPKAASPPASVGVPPERAVREAQELLAALGYKPGAADGTWGGRSAKAYAAFLRDAGLPPGDMLTPEGLRTMRALAKRRGYGTATGMAPRAEPRQQVTKTRSRLLPNELHRAAREGDIDGLKAALKAGADVNARDRRGWTALMHAANQGYKLMVRPLLKAKADPDVQAADGATALFMASVHGHSEIMEMLVKAGADIAIRGPKGKTAVDVALARGDSAVLRAFVFRDCPECPEMVVLPGGSYMMGSPGDEAGRGGDEGPRHRVTIPRPIAVGKYEVTFAEWDVCVAAGGCGGYRPGDRGWGRGRRPVVNVSWEDVKSYVEWVSGKTGKRYRLLSESEWEYAARAGTTGPFHFGSTISTDQGNYDGNYTYGSGRGGVYREKTASAGSFPANGFGLHDVHGNVWEWVEDCWHGDYSGASADGSAWTTGGNCGERVLRGGSWYFIPGLLRSAYRNRFTAGFRNDDLGFRIARTLTP